MAGSASQTAYSGLGRWRNAGGVRDAVRPVVVILRLLVAVLAFGVTVVGLNVQLASTGNPEHEKLIGLGKEPCGVTVTVKGPAWFPADTVSLEGVEDTAKSGAFTISVAYAK